MSDEITFRPLREDDAPQIYQVALEAWRYSEFICAPRTLEIGKRIGRKLLDLAKIISDQKGTARTFALFTKTTKSGGDFI